MADDVTEEVLRVWNDFESTARTAKRATANPALRAAQTLEPAAQPLNAAWTMVHPFFDDNYTLVDPYGVVNDKTHLEKAIRSGSGIFIDYHRTEHEVRANGDTAVYVSLVRLTGERGGIDVSGQYRETHVLVKRDNGWVVLASHMTKINEPAGAHPITGKHAA